MGNVARPEPKRPRRPGGPAPQFRVDQGDRRFCVPLATKDRGQPRGKSQHDPGTAAIRCDRRDRRCGRSRPRAAGRRVFAAATRARSAPVGHPGAQRRRHGARSSPLVLREATERPLLPACGRSRGARRPDRGDGRQPAPYCTGSLTIHLISSRPPREQPQEGFPASLSLPGAYFFSAAADRRQFQRTTGWTARDDPQLAD